MSEIVNNQTTNKISRKLLQYSGALLFLLMLAAPFELNVIKISIISLLVTISIINILIIKRIQLAKPVLIWFLSFIGFGIFFSIWAMFMPYNRIDLIIRSMPVNILWPILYFLVMPFINSEEVIELLHKTMILGALLISLYLVGGALSYLGVLPIPSSFFSLVKPVVGKYDASIQLFLPSTTSLLFLIPFLVSYLLLQIFKKHRINPTFIVLALVLGIPAIIITARRALILNLLITPVLIYIFLYLARVNLSKTVKAKLIKLFVGFIIICFVAGIILIKYEILNLDPLVDLFINGFDFSEKSQDEGSIARAEQSVGLIQSWKDYPILGSGLGSASEYVNRSEATPWVYELSYLTLLFQTGIVGLLFYFGLLFWIFYKGIMLIRENSKFIFIIPSLIGCFCFLLGNASNPYIIAFDHMWTIFIPIGFINFCCYKKNSLT
ncbi:O-antigen ligase family protein [Pedobacter gandavensis]|uniref:O-antigen ligase family protein n=1 Tax=Pedobacter gandavensis TaxID=2679963 RepID=UPI002930373B|nr:O-antigen ligase family protein [Pedobacter gandavensis]